MAHHDLSFPSTVMLAETTQLYMSVEIRQCDCCDAQVIQTACSICGATKFYVTLVEAAAGFQEHLTSHVSDAPPQGAADEEEQSPAR